MIFVWLDLEMSGLLPDKHVILEIACIITDPELNVLGEYDSAIFQKDYVIDPWYLPL